MRDGVSAHRCRVGLPSPTAESAVRAIARSRCAIRGRLCLPNAGMKNRYRSTKKIQKGRFDRKIRDGVIPFKSRPA
ncbi:hypothetical protein WI23_22290 [Burkholderia oklahomensis C6786]|nr:hypothetical protein WI23_22290 [Burkholderia oklahomensis C6786]KUY47370.1 hypothetical protein WI23_29245 [Burkholderia oklahomensis C6786]